MAFRKRPVNAEHEQAHHHRLAVTAQRVLLRRRALGLTQKALAERCDMPYQIVSLVERGKQDLYVRRLAALAEALDVTTDYLLGRALEGYKDGLDS